MGQIIVPALVRVYNYNLYSLIVIPMHALDLMHALATVHALPSVYALASVHALARSLFIVCFYLL